eukprot:UN10970
MNPFLLDFRNPAADDHLTHTSLYTITNLIKLIYQPYVLKVILLTVTKNKKRI